MSRSIEYRKHRTIFAALAFIIVGSAFISSAPLTSQVVTYYISTTGNDENPGTDSAQWQTLTTSGTILKPGNILEIIPGEGHKYTSQTTGNKSLKVAGLQMNVSLDIKKNKVQIIEGIKNAAAVGASFLVTPEGSLSGYTSKFNQEEVLTALKEVQQIAMDFKVGLLIGTCYKDSINNKLYCYNQVRVYTPEGEYLGNHSKILRCSPLNAPGTGEMADFVEGYLRTFDWNGIRFGILICNDLFATPGFTTYSNPYLPWKLKQMGAQIIFHCTNSGTDQQYKRFHESSLEAWASALHIPIMEVNAAKETRVINAQSGLITHKGERSLLVPDNGVQFFNCEIEILPRSSNSN